MENDIKNKIQESQNNSEEKDTLCGSTIGGKYEIVEKIATGGMGTVYKVKHLNLNCIFALKLLPLSSERAKESFLRFKREAETASNIGHENIVKIFDFDQTEKKDLYMVMEYLDGEELRSIMQKKGKLDWSELKDILFQLAGGLHAAHRQGIVHRDLKPENIFLVKKPDGNYTVKILDFGISKIKESQIMLTQPGEIIGTPFYMSPEQAKGDLNIDYRSDIFSLGALVFETLAGQPPFSGKSPHEILSKILFDPPEVFHKLRPELPVNVQKVIEKALNKDPDERYKTAVEFIESLDKAIIGQDTSEETAASEITRVILSVKDFEHFKRKIIFYIIISFLCGAGITTLIILLTMLNK